MIDKCGTEYILACRYKCNPSKVLCCYTDKGFTIEGLRKNFPSETLAVELMDMISEVTFELNYDELLFRGPAEGVTVFLFDSEVGTWQQIN